MTVLLQATKPAAEVTRLAGPQCQSVRPILTPSPVARCVCHSLYAIRYWTIYIWYEHATKYFTIRIVLAEKFCRPHHRRRLKREISPPHCNLSLVHILYSSWSESRILLRLVRYVCWSCRFVVTYAGCRKGALYVCWSPGAAHATRPSARAVCLCTFCFDAIVVGELVLNDCLFVGSD